MGEKTNYVGKIMIVNMLIERGYSGGSEAPYPSWVGEDIPVKVLAEYPTYYLVEVQPHINSHCIFPTVPFTPYRVTIDKLALKNNEFVWREAIY